MWGGNYLGSSEVESKPLKTKNELDFLKVLRPHVPQFHTLSKYPAFPQSHILEELLQKHTKCPSFTCGLVMSTWWERCANSPSRKTRTHTHRHAITDHMQINLSKSLVLTFLSWIRLEKQTERKKDTPHLHYRMTLTEREGGREHERGR